jgi:hypothetical protein
MFDVQLDRPGIAVPGKKGCQFLASLGVNVRVYIQLDSYINDV